VRLPEDSCLCDFWCDSRGRWHVISQREVQLYPSPGYVSFRQFITRWDQQEGGKWQVAATDSALDPFGGCISSARLEGTAPRPAAVTTAVLLDSMRIGFHRDSTLRELQGHSVEDAERWVWVPSSLSPAIGLEMMVVQGDSQHAMEPVFWVDRGGEQRTTIHARGDSHDDTGGQLAFADRGGFLLVVAEDSGAYPAVTDMHTGRVVFRASRPSARAVWVPAPQ